MSKKQTTIEDQLYITGFCLLLAAPAIWMLYRYLHENLHFMDSTCLLHDFTGYYCPGCGGTRAVYALMHLQLWRSFCYYPPVPYCAAVYLWFMISHTIEKLSRHRLCVGMKWNPGWLWAVLVLLVLNVLVKDSALFFFHVDLMQLIG